MLMYADRVACQRSSQDNCQFISIMSIAINLIFLLCQNVLSNNQKGDVVDNIEMKH